MKILFSHPSMPAQYKHLCRAFGALEQHQVVFLTRHQNADIAGVSTVRYSLRRQVGEDVHSYLTTVENAVLQGQETWRACKQLRDQEGFTPDVICVHPMWGDGLYLKDIYPDAMMLAYCETFGRLNGGELGFDPEFPSNDDAAARLRMINSVNLLSLEAMDWGVSPTFWQRSLFPSVYHSQISVLHDGIDTHVAKPDPEATLTLVNGAKIYAGEKIITYVSRGLVPHRGFHTFMRAVKPILEGDEEATIVVVGSDDVSYGPALPGGTSYRHFFIKQLGLAPLVKSGRLQFVGRLEYPELINLFQISAANIYLTVPSVLSWSALEAMACGCAMVMSDTTPVGEIVDHGYNAMLVDFFSAEQLSTTVLDIINKPESYKDMRHQARETILQRYALEKVLPLQLQLIQQVAGHSFPPAVEALISNLYLAA